MNRIVIDVMTGEQATVQLNAEEIAELNANSQAEPNPRIAEIRSRLKQIDEDSMRPLRAIATGSDTLFDRNKLASLDAEAVALRAELADL